MSNPPVFKQRLEGRRSGKDRRSGAERRRYHRRVTKLAVAEERRHATERRAAQRREFARRQGEDRRKPPAFGPAPGGVLGVTRPRQRPSAKTQAAPRAPEAAPAERHRARARRLPEEFMAETGTPVQRLAKIVRRLWPRYPLPVRAGVADELIPLLSPLIDHQVQITDELRSQCEAAVTRWMGRFG